MRLTTKGRFAVTAMIDLAMQDGSDPVTLADISRRQKISLSYLEQLFAKLRRCALVDSFRGPGGGYCLAKDMGQVSVAEIILAVDERLDATPCAGAENRPDDLKCRTDELWAQLNQHILGYLGSVSLGQLVEDQKATATQVTPVQDMRDTVPKRQRVTASA